MSQRQRIARSRRQRARFADTAVVTRAPAPAIQHGGRGALLSGTAFAALVACGLFAFNDGARAQSTSQLPTGGVVTGGSATITQTGTSQLTINQTTDRGVIDWRSFSIGQGNRVDFVQPGRTSVTLNRVTGPDPSVISGMLNANGQIVLINQAGVLFAGGAQVNVESLIASTANVANPQAFMAGGKIAFDQASANPNARVVNDGAITVRDGGLVALLGPSAANNGVINARLGRVTIAGAETFTVDLNGDGLVNFAVGKPVSQTPRDADGKAQALASNTGTINADGGQVVITAAAAREVVNGVVNVQGQINARSVTNEGGVIVFGGGETTQVNVGGTIDVSGAGATQKGGTVTVTASKVTVQSTARINANGGAGGGTVLVGGGKQGQGPIANAQSTSVATGAVITADATVKGNGGTVVVWADNTTVFGGTISANGGVQGGNGGFVETSGGMLSLLSGATVTATASLGTSGLWLMDPTDLTLGNVEVAAIEASLAAGTSVTTQTLAAGGANGDITLNANVSATVLVNQDVTWTLLAHGKIDLGSKSITITPFVGKNSSLVLDTATLAGAAADHSISGTGAITTTNLMTNAAIAGGSVNLTGTVAVTNLNFNSNGAVTINDSANSIFNIATVASTAGGPVTIVSTEITTINAGGISAGASSINITATGALSDVVVSGTISGAGVTLTGGRAVGGTGAVNGGAGVVSVKASGSLGINLNGTVAGTALTVQAGSGPVTINNIDNVFGSFSATGAIGGAVTVVHKGALTVNAVDAGTKAITFTTNTAGNLTLSGALTTSGGVTLNAAGVLSVEAAINATGGDVGLSGSSITQKAAGIITAGGLSISSTGSVDLTVATNKVATLAGSATSLGFLENDGFSVGSVNGIDGLSVAGGTLQLQAGGTIAQTKAITASSLAVHTTAGNINLTGATNSVGTFAASSTGAVGLLETDAVVVGSVAAVGALAALDGIAGNGVSIKAGGTVSQTKGIAGGATGLNVVTTSGDIVLNTVDNATVAVAFQSAGNVSYKASTDINITQVQVLSLLVSGASATGSLTLRTTGAATGITQNRALSATTLDVSTGAGGTVTLTDSSNLIDTVQSAAGLGTGSHQIVDSAGGLNAGPITSTGNVSLVSAASGLTVVGDIDVGANTLALKASGNNTITATAAKITAGTLTLETGTGGKATIENAAHNVATIATAGAGVGTGGISFKQDRVAGTSVGPITSTGNVSINDGVGPVTVTGTINVTNANVTLTASADTLDINAQISAGNGQVALLAQGTITQKATGAGITADSLRAQSGTGDVLLAPTGVAAADVNTVNTFAAISTAGSVSYTSAGTFNVGKVNNTSGINAATSVTLTVTTAGKTITQTAGADGAIVTPTLNMTTNGGDVTINSTSNDIAALGTVSLGSGALTVSTARAGGFDVGAVTANGGISVTNTAGDLTTSAAIVSDGDILLRSTTGSLTLGGTVTSNNKGITLQSKTALDTGAFLVSAPTAVTGDVTLISDTSTVTVGAGGVTVGDTLTIQIGPGLLLNVSGPITGATSVALHADAIDISAAINASGTITLAPVTVGTATTVGGAAAPGFVIDSTELMFLTSAGTLTIGKQSTGTTTSGAITVAGGTVSNANLNLFTTAGITQTGSLTVNGGSGALSVTAVGDVVMTTGAIVGSLTGSTTSGKFSVLRSGGAAQLLTVTGITTSGGDINIRNFDGDVTVSGAVSSGGGNILFGSNGGAATVVTVNAGIDAGAGTIVLFGQGGVTQGAAGTLTAANLAAYIVSSNGSITLTAADNAVTGDVTLSASSGGVSFRDTTGFNIASRDSITVAGLLHTVVGGDTAGIRAGSGDVSLIVGGNVTQSASANDGIVGTTLSVTRIGATNPSVTLDNASNAVTNLGTVSIGTGTFTLVDAGGITITGAATAGAYSVKTDGGGLTQNVGATINTSASDGTISLTTLNGGIFGVSISLNDNLNAGSGLVSLSASGSVSQSAGAITAATVSATASGIFGSVNLNSATNAFGAISGSGAFGFSATTTKSLTANAITSSSGSISLTTTGATSDLSVNAALSATAGTVTLTSGRDISQTATGGVKASSLQANATSGAVDLATGAANNSVSTIAGQANGSFAYTDANSLALTIGTVSTAGITSATNTITVKATKTGATLTTTAAVTASAANKGITLESVGDLTVNSTLTANAGSGLISLRSSAGSVIEQTSGTIAAAQLLALAATNVDIAQTSNTVGATGFAAKATTGFVVFINSGAITLDSVSGVNGVTAGGAVVLANTTGDISQTANGIITAGAGLGLAANNGSITLDKANLITGNVAVVNTPSGNVTIRNTGDFNIGTVGPITTAGVAVPTLNGVAASTAAGKFVALISDTGVITQSAGAVNRIQGAELRITTTDKDATLTNASNDITSVGNSNLGTGRLTVFDGVGDLTLSNPVVANGGVVLTTQTNFNLPGSITVANGGISLTSVTGSISLSSTLSAVNGQALLDAQGAGASVSQTAGSITALTLVVRANTNISLDGTVSAPDGISLTSITGSIALSKALSATNGQIQLDAGGAGSTITQTATATITAKTLIARASGSVTLNGADNDVGTIAGASTTGTFSYVDKTAVTIGSLTDSTAVTVTGITTASQDITILAGKGGTSGGISVDQAINAVSGIVRLQTAKGDITQAATGLITGNSLMANAFNGSVNLAAVANAVTFVAGTSGGSFRYQSNNVMGVSSITADAGALTTATAGITSNGDMALQTVSTLALFNTINAGAGTIRLRTTGGGIIGQTATGSIVADALLIDATGAVTLNVTGTTNDVNTLAGRTTSGVFKFQDKNGFTVGTIGADGLGLGPTLPIGPVTGITTAGGDITLAAAAGQLTLNEAINAGVGGGTIRLYTGAGDLTQGVNGTLTGGSLLAVSAAGMVNLTGATNNVTGIAGSAFTSFLFQNQIGYAVSNVAFTGEGVVPAATGITANSGGGGTAFVVDLAVASGTLAINGPVSSANGMIVYRRTPTGAAGAINVGGGAGNPGNDIGMAKLLIVDLTGASPGALYGATPGAGAGGLFTVPTPATGFSPLAAFGSLTGGTSNVGELNALNSTVYFFANASTIQSLGGGGSTFGLLGIYGQNNTVNLTTSVRNIDPNTVRSITAPFSEPLVSGALAAFNVRHDGLATATEQFNSCPIGTINCVVFTTPIAAPSVSTDDVVIGVAGAPLDDSGIVLVNQGNEELIFDTDEEKEKKRKRSAGQ